MTLNEAYLTAKQVLSKAQIESTVFDTVRLIKHHFGYDRSGLALNSTKKIGFEECKLFLDDVNKRAKKIPLQYIIGEWDFMDIPFFVGDGVLIPREDTEVLVTETVKKLNIIQEPKVLDLCAGSGTVGITISKMLPDADVKCVELSEKAIYYLEKNIKRLSANIEIIKADILKKPQGFEKNTLDALVSNPPYITKKEMETLQEEVKKEPEMALFGGNDGLVFYRAIADNWISLVKKGGILAVEIGYKQADDVAGIFSTHLEDIEIIKDFNRNDRVVLGKVKNI